MSGADLSTADPTTDRYGDVIVVGGGCYGGYYVRQLQRAARAGAIQAKRIVVVDHDAECAVAREAREPVEPWPLPVEIRVEEWSVFFRTYLDAASVAASGDANDAIVPSPLMPHLMAEWLVDRARARWPGRAIDTRPLARAPELPWERAGNDGTHYVSFADWMCPVNCIEPRICPHTREARNWSMPLWADDFVMAERVATGGAAEAVVLHCRHRAYGVGMFDTNEVVAADGIITRLGNRGAGEAFIGTMSHCHGALTRLVIGSAVASNGSPRPLDLTT